MNNKTEKPKFLGTKTVKSISKMGKTVKLKIPTTPSEFNYPVIFLNLPRSVSETHATSGHCTLIKNQIMSSRFLFKQ